MINNRQGGGGGRRRGRGGGGSGGGGGGNGPRGPHNNGSRIDSRARGNATQLHEKYKNMAADAQRAGDRVTTEYYLQFADHYFRVLSEQRGRVEDQPRRTRDDFDYEGDDEFADEGEPIRSREQWDAGNPEPARDEPRRREGGDDRGPRENGRDGNRDSSNRENNREVGRREWRDRPERVRADAPVAGQHRAEPIGPGESLEHRAAEVLDADRPLDPPMQRRRGRGRQEDGAEPASPSGFEADRLPPALTPTIAANDAAPAADSPAKPRRRRARPEVTETPTAAE